jgi:cell division protein FtsL
MSLIARRIRPYLKMPLWVVPVLIAMSIGSVWLRLAIVRTTYSITQTEKSIRQLQLEREQMELRVTALRSPRRLELLARTRFGLSQPKSEQIVHPQGGAP